MTKETTSNFYGLGQATKLMQILEKINYFIKKRPADDV